MSLIRSAILAMVQISLKNRSSVALCIVARQRQQQRRVCGFGGATPEFCAHKEFILSIVRSG